MRTFRAHLLVICVLVAVMLTGAQSAIQNALTEQRFGWTPRDATGQVALVAIDAASIETVGVWPWPRRMHAELLGQLTAAGATDIVFDVDFSSPSTPEFDNAFAKALEKAGGSVILPAFKQISAGPGGKTATHVSKPLPEFSSHSWTATVNIVTGEDGSVHRYSYGELLDGEFFPSAGALLAGRYEQAQAPFMVDFGIDPRSVPTVSYADILNGAPEALARVKDRKVVIGGTAIELGDRFNVPHHGIIAGPMLQVLAAETILQDRQIQLSSRWVTLGGLALIALGMFLAWGRFSATARLAALLGLSVLIEMAATLLQAAYPVALVTAPWHVAILAYIAAIALDEIDFRSLLVGVAEGRFRRIALSLGDGLVCTDSNGAITLWNPAAARIFGYDADEMTGASLDAVCTLKGKDNPGGAFPFSLFSQEELAARGGKVMELEGRRKNGETFALEASLCAWEGTQGHQYAAVLRDITVRKKEEERIRYLAEHDTLTTLPNRNTLRERLNEAIGQAEQDGGEVALLLVGLDKFKTINDTLGHACGDQVLRTVAKRLQGLVAKDGLTARLGGDEFAILLSGADVRGQAEMLGEQAASAATSQPVEHEGRAIRIHASVGIALYPDHAATPGQLLANADLALNSAKCDDSTSHVTFEQAMREDFEAQLSLESELRRALDKEQFELFYQPQFSLVDGRLIGAEALIRWRHPERGLVPPGLFMPVVNASAISDQVALWVMRTACKQGRRWQEDGHDIRIGVNLSPSQFQTGDLVRTVKGILAETGFTPELLELEVTEDILLDDDAKAQDIFSRLQDLGIHLAFDDFGTGYASLTHLKKFPLDRLKIDQTFVRELQPDSTDEAIVRSTITLCEQLGLSVIAEGIEDAAAVEMLAGMGCQEGQGYHFGKPVPVPEFEDAFLDDEAGMEEKASARARRPRRSAA